MSKKIRNLKRMPPRAETLAISTPAVLAALALLGTSLRVTSGSLPGNADGSSHAGSKAIGTRLAANARTDKSSPKLFLDATPGDFNTTVKFKFTTTTKHTSNHKLGSPSLRGAPSNILGK